jgi:hypothetical protein
MIIQKKVLASDPARRLLAQCLLFAYGRWPFRFFPFTFETRREKRYINAFSNGAPAD